MSDLKNKAAGPEATTDYSAVSLMTAPFELMAAMNQCALAWATLPLEIVCQSTRPNPVESDNREKSPTNSAWDLQRLSTPSGFAWLAAPPVITGIEDTVNDQVFQPRPSELPQRDILTLWKRSNEFGANDTPPFRKPDMRDHSQAA